jgi:hypothetical protein
MNQFENSHEQPFESALQHSFFKTLENDLNPAEPKEPVGDFFLTEENLRSNTKKNSDENGEFNDNHKLNADHFLSTRSTKKSETPTYGGALVPGSNQDYLFSGFFGQKVEMMSPNFYTITKPFPMAEDEKKFSKTYENEKFGSAFESINPKLVSKKPKAEVENFNGSFFSISMNKPKNLASNNFNTQMNTSNISNMSGVSSQSTSFNDLVKSVSLTNLNKKKKVLSSEEIQLEKIKKEKEEMQRLRNVNTQLVEKAKIYNPKPLNPSPLTLIKPFNLSSNNSKMLMKKRLTNTHIDEVNSKIMETMKKKCEGVGEKIKETVFINDTMKLQKTPTNVRYMKKSLGRSVSRSKSPIKKDCEEELMSLSSRIEKYCTISGINPNKPRSRSPLKVCFGNNNHKENEDKMLNLHMNNILNTDSSLGRSTSIRKHFNSNNMSTEEKISKDMNNYKFKARPLNKNIFIKKTPEIESFESVLQKTRMEKQIIDKKEKDLKKMNKVTQIKQNKFIKSINPGNKENCSASFNRHRTENSNRMNVE